MRRSTLSVFAVAATVAAQTSTAPVLRSAVAPAVPVQAVAGGEVILELSLQGGTVTATRIVRSTPPFTDAVRDAVRRWSFQAGSDPGATSTVIVAAVMRPPTLLLSGPVAPDAREVAAASAGAAVPTLLTPPAYPPTALGDGVVVVEVAVTPQGTPGRTRVVRGAAGFDNAALEAVRSWRFAPGTGERTAYAVFGFRSPVTGGGPSIGNPVPSPRT